MTRVTHPDLEPDKVHCMNKSEKAEFKMCKIEKFKIGHTKKQTFALEMFTKTKYGITF